MTRPFATALFVLNTLSRLSSHCGILSLAFHLPICLHLSEIILPLGRPRLPEVLKGSELYSPTPAPPNYRAMANRSTRRHDSSLQRFLGVAYRCQRRRREEATARLLPPDRQKQGGRQAFLRNRQDMKGRFHRQLPSRQRYGR